MQISNGSGPYVTPVRPSNEIGDAVSALVNENRRTKWISITKISILASFSPKHTRRPGYQFKAKQYMC